MKATTLLERQHRNLQQLCEAVESGSASVRRSLLPQLAGDLAAHIAVEEQIFYPTACDALHEEASTRFDRSRHAQAKQSLDHALDVPIEGEDFARAIGELRSVLDLHAEEEEELLFPRLELVLDADKMRELALSMLAVYHARVEAGYSPSPPSSSPAQGSGRPSR